MWCICTLYSNLKSRGGEGDFILLLTPLIHWSTRDNKDADEDNDHGSDDGDVAEH